MTEPRDDLSERIARAQEKRAAEEASLKDRQARTSESISAGAAALRYGAEFGASVFIGILIGLGIDFFAGTKPWGLLIMMGFGLAAGLLNVIRAYRRMTADAQAYSTGPDHGAKDNGTEG